MSTGELLRDWSELADDEWTGLLVGNGSSIAVWPAFEYRSLYEAAKLHPDDTSLFEALETQNFEQVLADLKTAGVVAGVLGMDVEVLADRYVSIQGALFDAVHASHVPWPLVSRKIVPSLSKALREYQHVFSTNYDLVLYWASMDDGGTGFIDYMWGDGNSFDAARTTVFEYVDDWTRILFLHGGIHLRRLRSGGTRKAVARDGAILDQFKTTYADDDSPLLVSEGESRDKLASITRSDYLSFAYETFSSYEDGLVIFGHSLGEQDDHLVRPLRAQKRVPVAISMMPNDDPDKLSQEQDRIRSQLPGKTISFFDATTHPLGASELRAKETIFGRVIGR